jgi:phosphatidylserine decarboxylase
MSKSKKNILYKGTNYTRKHISKNENHVIKKFKNMLEKNPIERQYMTTMITSIPKNSKFRNYPKSLNDLFNQLNNVLTVAPEFNTSMLVGKPILKIIMWTMGSPEGFAAYKNDKINKMFGELLNEWKKFLDSPASRYVLNTSKKGWFGKEASKFIDLSEYQHDPTKPYNGFTSWNNFFTRKLVPGARQIDEPHNNNIINSACESTIYRISHNVQPNTSFWIKSQPYSIEAMLNADKKYVEKFTGGTIYQAFLSPFNYHRWHSPINGTIEKAYVKKGVYFAQVNELGENPHYQRASEPYLTNIQTRALIFIKADNPKIGTVCFMPVGMVEIASCNINKNIKPGHHVKKGDELGYFAYGGSTHCLFFEPGVIKKIFHKKNDFVKMGKKIAEINE